MKVAKLYKENIVKVGLIDIICNFKNPLVSQEQLNSGEVNNGK